MKKILATLLSLTMSHAVFADTAKDSCSSTAHQKNLEQAIKWYHNSAEQKALYHQAFNLGSNYVSNWVQKNNPKEKTWGVVLDIDETVLDNSWYFNQCIDNANKTADFEHYVSLKGKSVALPGAVEFIQLVHRLGGYVSLVTNRDGSYKDNSGNTLDATVKNLKQQNIEFDQLILANEKKSKTPMDKNPRFEAVQTGRNYNSDEMVWTNKLPAHKVIAYFGDNIQDFPKFKQPIVNALSEKDPAFDHFGHGYFILPNPIYGSWQKNKP